MQYYLRRLCLSLALLWEAGELPAAYQFLGDIQSYAVEGSGVSVLCADSVHLQVRFLLPEMLRVTVQRSGDTGPLLEDPLARTSWPMPGVETTADDSTVTLRSSALELILHRSPCRLTVRNLAGDTLCVDDAGMGMGWDGPEVRVWKRLLPGERFYGLGLKAGNMDKRGSQWEMWNTDFPAYTDRTDPLYQSIPFFIALRNGQAYGIYFNNSYRSRFNFGAGNLRYYSFSAEQGPLDYFIMAGPAVADVVQRYTELTGRLTLPPLWALGYQQSRWSYYPQSEVLRLAQTFREKQIPADVIYLDIHYMDGYRVFTWDRSRFPDPPGMLKRLAQQGFKIVTIIDPGVKADSAYGVARDGLRDNHFLRYPDGTVYTGEVWPGVSYFPDFSAERTRSWWAGNCNRLREAGVRGFWNDMNEPAVWGQAFPPEVLFDDHGLQSSQKKLHNLYGLLMAKGTYEGMRKLRPNERPFVLTRAGFAGEQRYTAAWTGDNVASWEHLELGVRMMLGMGLSGMPFVGTDIGGFMGTPSPELYARWMEVGALAPFSRTHTHHNSAEQDPWSFGEDVETISRHYLTLRYRLLPYFYTLFNEASQTGAPLWRPLFWYHPQEEHVYEWEFQHQFYLGRDLLVAPVTNAGQSWKRLYLPAGRWLDWNNETVYDGSAVISLEAPLDRLPLFLREGAIIPLRDSVQFADERPIKELTLEIFPGPDSSSFDLYEDDGKSFDYQSGRYHLTRFSCRRTEDGIQFQQDIPHDGYTLPARTLVLRFHAVEAPLPVMVNGRAIRDYAFDPQTRLLTVRLTSSGKKLTALKS